MKISVILSSMISMCALFACGLIGPKEGWSRVPYGELIGFDQSKLGGEEYIGKKVEVFGKKVGDGTSIEGSKKYYIKLLE